MCVCVREGNIYYILLFIIFCFVFSFGLLNIELSSQKNEMFTFEGIWLFSGSQERDERQCLRLHATK